MSRRPSDTDTDADTNGVDPLRPADSVDAPEPAEHPSAGTGAGPDAAAASAPQNPRLSGAGWARFLWRQLTSMRTALVLLLLLGLAAVPGSLVPQRSSDPNGVIQYQQQHPDWFKFLDSLQVFDTYTSFWFSAVYLLLFVSLIGCIIPRTAQHLRALRAKPPATPANLSRLVGYVEADASTDAEAAIDAAAAQLKRAGYRIRRVDRPGRFSVAAERGYLRETGNLVFHASLVGVLVTVAIGGGFIYTGERLLIQGQSFTNLEGSYDTLSKGRWFSDSLLTPYTLRLDDFTASYRVDPATEEVSALDYTASVSTRVPGGAWKHQQIKVNQPLTVGDTQVYLLGNGYAPVLTIRDPSGHVVSKGPVPFRAQDTNNTGLGVVKVPDGLAEQVGMIGFFYPVPVQQASGALSSAYPVAGSTALVSLNVYTGDLQLGTSSGGNVYNLDTSKMKQVAGVGTSTAALQLTIGKRVELPGALGSIEFSGLSRYVGLDIHRDPTPPWVGSFVALAFAGLVVSLFVPRRRVWVAATPAGGDSGAGCRLEYAGLARGDDPRLEAAVAELVKRHLAGLGATPEAAPRDPLAGWGVPRR